ncbi:MAG: 1,4-alpha-glucan branching protein GlgB [Clostridia bacterium]|nr:1,4-alpha-glucan branching protein GlgB [Clostridia bacterium]
MESKMKNTDLAAYYFHQGTNYYSYEYLGCHEVKKEDTFEYTFRVWAPNADSVMLVSDFTSWDNGLQMRKNIESGIWELVFVSSESLIGKCYKYKIWNRGNCYYKADPYAFHSETLMNTASIVCNIDDFKWNDAKWFEYVKSIFHKNSGTIFENYYYSAPLNIYEINLGSWKTRDGKSNVGGKNYLNYRDIADELAPYLKRMGYTHVELMPIMEHPYDGSWGYQVGGYYAPTSRFGEPKDFMYFVNKLHEAGIGVILDWVPAHFPKDAHGLYEFDGQPLYEYQGYDRMEHKVWGTRFFDLGREEIQSFLVSNALFWFRKYHIDGLRVDAVASMLYLDFDRDPGEWIPNDEGENKNKEAIAFLKKLNSAIFKEFGYALMIAEESTDWPMITKPVSQGGLGFNYKWNMGWANDMYEYVESDPIYRKYMHDKLTFPMMYAFNENYIYPISHDEVVHGKKSLINKMYGSYDEKFSLMRAFMTYMIAMPGKKMTFMGTEFAQFREWDYENQLEWFMLDYPRHKEMQRFIADLNNFYLANKQLWEIDNSWDGYEWIETNESNWNIISFKRKAIDKSELIIVVNFSPVTRDNYTVKVKEPGKYEEIFTTDEFCYGGKGVINSKNIKSAQYQEQSGEKQNYFNIDLPANGAVILRKVSGKVRRV